MIQTNNVHDQIREIRALIRKELKGTISPVEREWLSDYRRTGQDIYYASRQTQA